APPPCGTAPPPTAPPDALGTQAPEQRHPVAPHPRKRHYRRASPMPSHGCPTRLAPPCPETTPRQPPPPATPPAQIGQGDLLRRGFSLLSRELQLNPNTSRGSTRTERPNIHHPRLLCLTKTA